jgi:hypothetical protein
VRPSQLEAERPRANCTPGFITGARSRFDLGLHEYLMDFLEGISLLGDEINKDFLVPAYTSNAAPPDATVQRQSSSQPGPQPLE